MSTDETGKPKLSVIAGEELDQEEEEFRRLRCDLPGVKGAADAGMITVSVGRQPTPKHEFYRTNRDFRPIVNLVSVEVGLDKQFVAVDPGMIEALSSIGITSVPHCLYLIISPRGSLRIIPISSGNGEDEKNEWVRTKELALLDGVDAWARMYTDMENGAYKSFPAPAGRFGEPNWPTIKPARLFRMAFRDKGRLIDSTDHMLVAKWAGRGDKG